ncbi:tRNA (adenosine(37)-N6)-threonylcarbamoyltransferase complex dimerization subunit type 1 TsaB [Phaeovulum sp.]|uniref:tRNA (adenosine(37)-N6)-threonylcarbamoyltransferase complex dimerization subunit type 1 TsaB n=1 Tax=Phaeovulum sp. TaxID=2934796 RepID=UPI0039E22355
MPSDPLILGFDTSAAHCAAALLRGSTLLETRSEDMAKGQAERLMPMLEEMLARHGIHWRDLTALGVGIGPGNFTGVRLSVSAARGLALALRIPAIGVSLLEARALDLPRPLTVVEDARRGQVYAQHFGPDSAPELISLDQLTVVAGALTGSAAGALGALLPGVPVLAAALPLPVAIARIAAARYPHPQPRPAPLYLRAADASPPSDPAPLILEG